MNILTKLLNCKIIISEAAVEQNLLHTYSSHQYSVEDSKSLESHSVKLVDTSVTSPSNLAFSRREPIYINDVSRMFSLYSEFVVNMLIRNQTKSLYVVPAYSNGDLSPWGVIWVEFSNHLNQSDEDIYDLSQIVAESINRQLSAHLNFEMESRLKSELSSMIPEHVLRKLEMGLNPREVEIGYLLNIDLAGSTKFAGLVGDEIFRAFIKTLSYELSKKLRLFKFVEQMIIWDAFIYTRVGKPGDIADEEIEAIVKSIKAALEEVKVNFADSDFLSFRAILHYGDTTRDFTPGETKTWGVVGAALAESCKMESKLKGKSEIIWASEDCGTNVNNVNRAA